MNVLEAFGGPQSGAVRQLAQQFGLNEQQVNAALTGLAPALAAGFKKNTATPDGMQSLLGALGGGAHQRYVEQPETLGRADTVTDGNGILGHVFGSKEVSREVAAEVSSRTGIATNVLKGMLPLVAAMMMGEMSKRTSRAPAAAAAATSGAEGLSGLLGSILDADRDGSMVDDVIGVVGRFLRG